MDRNRAKILTFYFDFLVSYSPKKYSVKNIQKGFESKVTFYNFVLTFNFKHYMNEGRLLIIFTTILFTTIITS